MRVLRAAMLAASMLMSMQLMAQEMRYYDLYWKEVDKEKAIYYSTEDLITSQPPLIRVTKYFIDTGARHSIVHYVAAAHNAGKEIRQGSRMIWNKEGQLVLRETYENNKLTDSLISYYATGGIKRLEIYKDDEMLEGYVYEEDGTQITYYPFEQMPQFPGGDQAMFQYINRKIKFPKSALKAKAFGTVLATFIVGADGIVRDIEIGQSVHPDIDMEVIRVISLMPPWQPGKQDGRPVPVRYNIPIKFGYN
ncbi:hypothetical protein FVR03_18945 [Pontibacter qinzhouensis]|uniref:TonB C-terminal domain-containing protein n=1 Tax=Pontibacter qinzhouensis TaxID=2603253 RepID=A0A5C8JAP0_9BACT|nr:energy transducer TonB [Pontibacter qinzhouensis]TXK33737.1 hypothetical protein FVR03_18945 [Pontibacter qinzhouensis]